MYYIKRPWERAPKNETAPYADWCNDWQGRGRSSKDHRGNISD